MKSKSLTNVLIFLMTLWVLPAAAQDKGNDCQSPSGPSNNVILFITDGLRHDAVNADDAPTIYNMRQQGVDFRNSHSLFPTVTTANASAFATGHQLGDTGDFANGLYVRYPVATDESGLNLSWTPFLENNFVLADLNARYGGNYLGVEQTLEEVARKHCYITAIVGKRGPAAIQAISQLALMWNLGLAKNRLRDTTSFIMDDDTGKAAGAPIPGEFSNELSQDGLSLTSLDRSNGQKNGSPEDNGYELGTLAPNVSQQRYFSNAVTHVILPAIVKKRRPFLLVFWSRDPDGTQHNQGDSLNKLSPGINGPTSHTAIRNADDNLHQIMEYLKHADCDRDGQNCLDARTDVIVAADHGFSTISKGATTSQSECNIKAVYASGQQYSDVPTGCLPPGFMAIDLAKRFAELAKALGSDFKLKLYDPDFRVSPYNYRTIFDPDAPPSGQFAQHPTQGDALLGGDDKVPDNKDAMTKAQIVIMASGGSALIYLPQSDKEKNSKFAEQICKFLLTTAYVNGVFVSDDIVEDKHLGIPGALLFSNIGLMGTAKLPRPAIIVNFKSFSVGQSDLLHRAEIAETNLQQGQGMHGNLSRADTFNNMVAIGPDFKKNYPDLWPVSNADIAVTIAYMLGWKDGLTAQKTLRGRVMAEALRGRPEPSSHSERRSKKSMPGTDNHKRTLLLYQEFDGFEYYDEACLIGSAEERCN